MKKSNRQRELLLQKKRTKRNQSRKGKTYNPNKMQQRQVNPTKPDAIIL